MPGILVQLGETSSSDRPSMVTYMEPQTVPSYMSVKCTRHLEAVLDFLHTNLSKSNKYYIYSNIPQVLSAEVVLCTHKTTILCQFGLFRHKLTTISPSILNHFWWELYHFIIISSIVFNDQVQATLQGKPDTVQFTKGILTICLLNRFDQFFLIGRAIIVERLYGSEKTKIEIVGVRRVW